VEGDGGERKDKWTLIQELEKTYGSEKPETFNVQQNEAETVVEDEDEEKEEEVEKRKVKIFPESEYTFAIGGEKAYPHILLNDGWSLFVTMTVGDADSIKEAEKATASSKEVFTKNGVTCPKFIHTIDEEKR